MTAYQELRRAIAAEVSPFAKQGATLEWGRNSRTGEAIIRRGEANVRVVVSRTPILHDKASAIGRVRRALRSLGLDVPPAAPRVAPAKPRKRPTQGQRIAALEARIAELQARLQSFEAAFALPNAKAACGRFSCSVPFCLHQEVSKGLDMIERIGLMLRLGRDSPCPESSPTGQGLQSA